MNIFTTVYNQATAHVRKESRLASLTLSKAIKASGYELRSTLKEGMKKEAPGGEPWPETSPWTRYRLLKKSARAHARRKKRIELGQTVRSARVKKLSMSGATTALKRLVGAVRVKSWVNMGQGGQTIDNTKVHTGFISKSSSRWAAYHATAHTIAVTPKMRRMIYAAGLIVKAAHIRIPRRRTTEVVYEKNKHIIPEFVNRRIAIAMRGGDPRGVRMTWH